MGKYIRLIYVFILAASLMSPITCWAGDPVEKTVLETFLKSKSMKKRKAAFDTIIANTTLYSPLVLAELIDDVNKKGKASDELILLAAYFKQPEFLPPLIKMINNPDYSYDACIYSCPIIFALDIYKCFTPYQFPATLNDKLVPVKDFLGSSQYLCSSEYSEKIISGKIKPSYPEGPGINDQISEMKRRSTEDLLKLAGYTNKDTTRRIAAAFVLEYRTVSIDKLPELYWLAMTSDVGIYDAAGEYLNSINTAIYTAETMNKARGKHQ